MGIGLIFKIAAVGILVTILSQVLKHSGREEHAFLISLAGLILVLSWIVPYIYDLFDTVQTLFFVLGGKMAEIIKIALLGITGVLFAVQFRQHRPEYAMLIGFALSVLVFSYVLGLAGSLLDEFLGLQQYLGDAQGYLGILMKVVGITYLCEFSAGMCKDAGFAAVSDQIEILGKLSVLFAGLPILLAVIRQIYGIL